VSTTTVIAGITATVKAGRKAVEGYKKINKTGRKHIAKKELHHGKDIDQNGCIGCVGKCIGPKCPFHRNYQPGHSARRRSSQ